MRNKMIILYVPLFIMSTLNGDRVHAKEISGPEKTSVSPSSLRKKIEGEILFLAPVALTGYKALEKESDLKQEHINGFIWSLQAQAPTVMGCIKEALNTEPPAEYSKRKKGALGALSAFISRG